MFISFCLLIYGIYEIFNGSVYLGVFNVVINLITLNVGSLFIQHEMRNKN